MPRFSLIIPPLLPLPLPLRLLRLLRLLLLHLLHLLHLQTSRI